MKRSSWLIATFAIMLCATTGWAKCGHGLLHFEVNSADPQITVTDFDPIGTVSDNATGSVALFCAVVRSESSSLAVDHAGKTGADRADSRAGNEWLEAEYEPRDNVRFFDTTLFPREDTRLLVDESGKAPNLVSISW